MKRVDVEVAFVAGLCVALPLYMLFTMRESDGSPNPLTLNEASALLLVVGCYVAALFPLRLLNGRRLFRPAWLWVPVLGSAFVAVAGYSFRFFHYGGSAGLWAQSWLFLCVWTLPPAAVVHYSGALVRKVRRWHGGARDNLSILPRW